MPIHKLDALNGEHIRSINYIHNVVFLCCAEKVDLRSLLFCLVLLLAALYPPKHGNMTRNHEMLVYIYAEYLHASIKSCDLCIL